MRYVVAAANAIEACPDGNERWLLGSAAAAVASEVYSTGRLRRTSTFTQSAAASVQPSELANTATCPRRCAEVAPSNDATPANPITPASSTVLAVLAGPENVWSAERSTPGSDAGSHGAVDPQDGPLFGSFVASGIKATTPAATTDAASPQRTLYGACPRADVPETARKTRAAARRRMQDSDRNGRPSTYVDSTRRAHGSHLSWPCGFRPSPLPLG